MEVKFKLFSTCVDYVNSRIVALTKLLASYQQALSSETKSSVGDKYETGRAMLHIEIRKAKIQLANFNSSKEIINKINIKKSSDKACLGSLIYTNQNNYFLAVSQGKVVVDNDAFFVLSTSSPIGKLLLGKQVGDVISFNNKNIEITNIL